MKLRSLGYRTDLMVRGQETAVEDRGDLLLVRTPSNPDFRWGNFLLFGGPPAAGDLPRWTALFRQNLPGCRHYAFGWEGGAGQVGAFLANGFRLILSDVLVRAAGPAPARELPVGLRLKPFRRRDWRAWAEVELLEERERPEGEREELTSFARYTEQRCAERQELIRSGRAQWWGAFLGEQLVSSAGLVWEGKLGRFQHVATHPDYRRRGFCRALLSGVLGSEEALALEQLVIVADPHYHAAALYLQLGFVPAEQQYGLERTKQLP